MANPYAILDERVVVTDDDSRVCCISDIAQPAGTVSHIQARPLAESTEPERRRQCEIKFPWE